MISTIECTRTIECQISIGTSASGHDKALAAQKKAAREEKQNVKATLQTSSSPFMAAMSLEEQQKSSQDANQVLGQVLQLLPSLSTSGLSAVRGTCEQLLLPAGLSSRRSTQEVLSERTGSSRPPSLQTKGRGKGGKTWTKSGEGQTSKSKWVPRLFQFVLDLCLT